MVMVIDDEMVHKELESAGFEYVSFEEEDLLRAEGPLPALLQPKVAAD